MYNEWINKCTYTLVSCYKNVYYIKFEYKWYLWKKTNKQQQQQQFSTLPQPYYNIIYQQLYEWTNNNRRKNVKKNFYKNNFKANICSFI